MDIDERIGRDVNGFELATAVKALPGFDLRAIGDGQPSELIDPSGQLSRHPAPSSAECGFRALESGFRSAGVGSSVALASPDSCCGALRQVA